MAKKKTKLGNCRLCGLEKELTYEHIPPKAAFNKNTRHISVSHDDYFKDDNILKFKPKGPVLQGGIGYYALCADCNSFLGRAYVPSYLRWVKAGKQMLSGGNPNYVECIIHQIEPLKILKQIVSMFLSINDWYLKEYPELAEFVRDQTSDSLPDKFRLATYLNKGGQFRYSAHSVMYDPQMGIINFSEITFPPYGYVLAIDYEKAFEKFTDITDFKNFTGVSDVNIGICKLETVLPFPPLDYRSKEEIEKDINAAIQFKNNQKENSHDS